MDILENLQQVDNIEPVLLANRQIPEEIVYNEITRCHLIFFIVGGVFTLLMVML